MCKVNPEHKKILRIENYVKVIQLRILKALYGCMESAILLYDLYAKTLMSQGFVFNPYDRCIANSTIDWKKCTIAWYVDSNKLSHVDEHANTRMIEAISETFGELTVFRGVNQRFLGMGI